MPTRAQEALQAAKELAATALDWEMFFREVLGIDGLVRQLFTSPEELAEFEQTAEYASIQQLVIDLRNRVKATQAGTSETSRVITVRLSRSLHEQLRGRAHELETSINKMCISALLQPVQQRGFPRGTKASADTASKTEPTRVITVRLPASLHELLRAEAKNGDVGMNVLCLEKLVAFLENRPAEESMAADTEPLAMLLDPGTATKEEIAELFQEISILYRLVGGRGIQFSIADAREPVFAEELP